MDPMDTLLDKFSTTVHLKADKLQHVRAVLSKLAECKYTARSDDDLAKQISLSDEVRSHIINDLMLVNHLMPGKNNNSHQSAQNNKSLKISHDNISLGYLSNWMLSTPEFDSLILYFLYIDKKSYEQIAQEIVILNKDEVIQIQLKNIRNLYNELLS